MKNKLKINPQPINGLNYFGSMKFGVNLLKCSMKMKEKEEVWCYLYLNTYIWCYYKHNYNYVLMIESIIKKIT